MNKFDKTDVQGISKGNNRRSFLKKSATGAVVFSLPAKSVWGACSVSGAMSGNLSTNVDRHDCTLPALDLGSQPFKWLDLNKYVKDLFSHLDSNPSLKSQYIAAVDAEKAVNFDLPSELIASSPTCGEALASGDPDMVNLGCVYLNAAFGLYPGYSGTVQAVQLVNDVFLYIYTNAAMGTPVTLNDSDYGFVVNHATSSLVLS